MQRRTIFLTATLVAIGVLIWYIQRGQISPVTGGPGAVVIPVDSGMPLSAQAKEGMYDRAKELARPSGFINAQPFTLASLVGRKVILLDFWTYSCINCQRTLPYLKDWYAKYHDKGLEIVGVHTPEFDFEKDIANVRTAVTKFGITYPVVLDNDYGTWNAYANQYWPHEYLIDVDGFIVHDHIGEGDYDVTEKAIQKALDELMARQGSTATADRPIVTPTGVMPFEPRQVGTPELYLGSRRNDSALGSGKTGTDGQQTFTIPASPKADLAYLGGTWNITPEYAQCVSGCSIRLEYTARQANIVAGSSPATIITVRKDGAAAGTVPVSDETLYHLIDEATYGTHSLELQLSPGIRVFTFTFG